MGAENVDFLKWLAGLFGPAGFVLLLTNAAFGWWIRKTHGWHRDERAEWEKRARDERDDRIFTIEAEREAWSRRIDGFRQDIKDAFANVNGVSRDMAEALGKVVDVVTDLRVTVAGKGFGGSDGRNRH